MLASNISFGAPVSFNSGGFHQQQRQGGTPILDQFITIMRDVLHNCDPQKLDEVMEFEPFRLLQNGVLMQMRQELQAQKQRNANVNLRPMFEKVDPQMGKLQNFPFTDAAIAYLEFIRDTEVEGVARGDMEALHALGKGLQSVVNKFIHATISPSGGATMVPVLKKSLSLLVRTTIYIDRVEHRREDRAYSTASVSLALRALNACLAEKSTDVGRRIGAVAVGNLVLKLYKQMQREKMIPTIVSNMKSANLFAYSDNILKSERVTYHFNYGRHCLNSADNYTAYVELSEAYYLCHPNLYWHRRKILTFLIPAGLSCGIFPSPTILSRVEAAGLAEIFLPLCAAIARGDFRLLRQSLHKYEPAYRELKIYGYLYLRLEKLVWRSFIRTFARATSTDNTMSSTLSLKSLQAAIQWQVDSIPTEARRIFDGHRWSLVDVESLVGALLESRWIVGHLAEMENDTILAMSRRKAFPNIFDLHKSDAEAVAKAEEEERSQKGGQRGGVIRLSGVKAIG